MLLPCFPQSLSAREHQRQNQMHPLNVVSQPTGFSARGQRGQLLPQYAEGLPFHAGAGSGASRAAGTIKLLREVNLSDRGCEGDRE